MFFLLFIIILVDLYESPWYNLVLFVLNILFYVPITDH